MSVFAKFDLKQKLAKKGGAWLGTARSYLQHHVRGGDTYEWGSENIIHMSMRQVEEMAAEVAAAAIIEHEKEKMQESVKRQYDDTV